MQTIEILRGATKAQHLVNRDEAIEDTTAAIGEKIKGMRAMALRSIERPPLLATMLSVTLA